MFRRFINDEEDLRRMATFLEPSLTKLPLQINASWDAPDIVKALEENPKEEYVQLYIPFGNCKSCYQACVMIGTKMQKLRRIDLVQSLRQRGIPTGCLSPRDLAELMRLRRGTLEHVTTKAFMKGDQNAFATFFKQVASADRLKSFAQYGIWTLTNSRMSYNEEAFWLREGLLSATNHAKTLESLTMKADAENPGVPLVRLCQSKPGCSPEFKLDVGLFQLGSPLLHDSTLQKMCNPESSRLTSLTLQHVVGINERIGALTSCIRGNQVLRELKITTSVGKIDEMLTTKSALSLFRELGANTSLQSLCVSMTLSADPAEAAPLALAVQSIGRLRCLGLRLADEEGIAFSVRKTLDAQEVMSKRILPLLQGLAKNESIRELKISTLDRRCSTLGAFIQQFMRQALKEENITLEGLKLRRLGRDVLDEELRFWLHLNKLGRKDLSKNHDKKEQWVDTLIKERDNASVTCFLMLSNPSVYFVAAPAGGRSSGTSTSESLGKKMSFLRPLLGVLAHTGFAIVAICWNVVVVLAAFSIGIGIGILVCRLLATYCLFGCSKAEFVVDTMLSVISHAYAAYEQNKYHN